MSTVEFTEFRAAVFNVLGSRFSTQSSWKSRRPQVVRRLAHVLPDGSKAKASINLLTECYASDAGYLGPKLNLATITHRGSTIAYHRDWKLGRVWRLDWLGVTHGAVIAELSRDGVRINAVASHLPPFTSRARYREQCMRRLASFMAGWRDPILIGTDANWRGMSPFGATLGLVNAGRRNPTEMATTGALRKGQAINYALVRNMNVRRFDTLPGWGSDHHMLSVSLTAPEVTLPAPGGGL